MAMTNTQEQTSTDTKTGFKGSHDDTQPMAQLDQRIDTTSAYYSDSRQRPEFPPVAINKWVHGSEVSIKELCAELRGWADYWDGAADPAAAQGNGFDVEHSSSSR